MNCSEDILGEAFPEMQKNNNQNELEKNKPQTTLWVGIFKIAF